MSTRSNLSPKLVIENGNMSGNITSLPTIFEYLTIPSFGYSWAGTTPIGTISIQVSNDYSLFPNGQVKNAGNWVTVPLIYNQTVVQAVPLTGNSGAGFIEGSTGAYAVRTVYTATSGTGTLQATIKGKVA